MSKSNAPLLPHFSDSLLRRWLGLVLLAFAILSTSACILSPRHFDDRSDNRDHRDDHDRDDHRDDHDRDRR